MLLMPSASHHSSPLHQTKHQTWHCLCYACPFHPCSSFSTKETLPYVTVGTALPVLKVPITSLCFPLWWVSVMPKQQDFVPATQDWSSSITLGVAESGTSQLQLSEGKTIKTSQWLLPFTVPAPAAAVSCQFRCPCSHLEMKCFCSWLERKQVFLVEWARSNNNHNRGVIQGPVALRSRNPSAAKRFLTSHLPMQSLLPWS